MHLLASALLAWAPVIFASTAQDDPAFAAGVATRDVTPSYPIRLSGYGGRRSESTGVAQPIFAKALAIDDGSGPAVLLTLESCAVPESLTEAVHAALQDRHELPRERFAISVSHTHSAPMLAGALPTLFGVPIPPEHQERIDRYTRELREHLIAVAEAALQSRSPAHLEWSLGHLDFAANRRTAGGPTDHDLPVLRVRAPDGTLLAILANYACHCTTLGGGFNEIHGDWVGAAQHLIEQRHPGATAFITIGCGGDQNPQPRGTLDHVAQHASALADEVERLIAIPGEPLAAPLQCRFDRIELPFDTLPTRADFEALADRQDAIGHHARVQLARLDGGEALRTVMRYPVQTWRFGKSLAWVLLGGEVVVDYSLRLKSELDRQRLWVSAYANDVAGYIPSERILREGGYEGGDSMIYYDQPTRLKSGVEALIIDAIRAQLGPGFTASPAEKTGGIPPRSPLQSLAAIETEPGLRVELVAAEPLVIDPVAIDFADDGALFVAEMHDYPEGIDGEYGPGGRIKRLVDRDQDGVFDDATIFLDGLPFPTGVTVCDRGVLVCAAPDILYAEDTDTDGVADVRRVVLTGFATSNYQARVNSLVRGLDGWWYGANGLLGGSIGPPGSESTVDIGGRDFRFRLDGTVEPVAGLTQQGRACDDFGNWFGCDNSTLLWHYPFPEAWARRLAPLASPATRVAVARGDDAGRLFPIAPVLERFNDADRAGFVTSACGLEIHRSSRLGEQYSGDAFVCEPVHQLVRRLELEPRGATYEARRAPAGEARELLASRDPWFRPVQARTGPAGALWIVDMYRWVIEHPRWIPADRLAELDVRAGSDRGRIYRVVPAAGLPLAEPIASTGTLDLVNALIEAQGARRDRVRELLLAQRDSRAVLMLEVLARDGTEPAVRAAALATLAELDWLQVPNVYEATWDRHPGVRRLAIALAADRLEERPELRSALRARLEDPDAGVRCELAAALFDWPDEDAGELIVRLLQSDAGDPWLRAAALGSAQNHLDDVLRRLDELPGEAASDLVRLALARNRTEALDLGRRLASSDESLSVRLRRLEPILRALESSQRNLWAISDELLAAWRDWATVLRQAVGDVELDPELRGTAARWLACGEGEASDREALLGVIEPRTPEAVQREALDALARLGGEGVPAALCERAGSASPGVREVMVAVLLQRTEWTRAWLSAEEGRDLVGAATPEQRQRLLTDDDASVRQRAERWLSDRVSADRREVIERYRSAATSGDADRGAHAWDRVCARCHDADAEGRRVGPDLRAWTGFSREALLEAVFDPNATVLDSYVGYLVELDDGRLLSGRIEEESASGLTLVTTELERQRIPRASIGHLSRTGLSTMPEGLESELTPEDFADLVAWFEASEPAPKRFAGNSPETIMVGEGGTFSLSAAQAEIRGGDIVFEQPFQNVGYWHGESDRVAWKLELAASGEYEVELEYACDDGASGDGFVLETPQDRLEATVEGTGTWADYRRASLGRVRLPSGRQRIVLRPAGPPRQALMDLRALHFNPADE